MLADPHPAIHSRSPSPVPEYPLPPIEMLTNGQVWPSINREKNPTKMQRKKEKERHKGRQSPDEKDKDKDGFSSMEFIRWVANIRANPLYVHLSRKPSPNNNPPPLISRPSVTKSLSTNDWFIAIREIRLLRLSTRVNQLQDEGQWSYRQPRRQKEPAHFMAKTHWDYLREEGRWMRTDFREERKLKAVIGYEIGQELKELFSSGESPLKRRRIEGPGEANVGTVDEIVSTKMEVDEPLVSDLTTDVGLPSVPINAVISGLQELEELLEQPEEVLDNDEQVEDALAELEERKEEEAKQERESELGIDDELGYPVDSSPPTQNANDSITMEEDMDVENDDDDAAGEDFKLDIPDLPPEQEQAVENDDQTQDQAQEMQVDGAEVALTNGDLPPDPPPELKNTEDNPEGPAMPALPFENEEKDSDSGSNDRKEKGKGKEKEKTKLEDPALKAIREPILHMGREEFAIPYIGLPSQQNDEDVLGIEEAFPQLSMNDVLQSLFPELKPYAALPPAPVVVSNPKTVPNIKTNLRTVPLITSKKDPGNFRRVDETNTKVAAVTKHMKAKAILVSALNPGENFNPQTKEWDGSGDMVIYPSTSVTIKDDESANCTSSPSGF